MILTIGCSWTYGTGVEPDETFSAHLQNKLDTRVINGGHPGIDIPYAIWSAYRLFNKFKPEIVLFQVTTLDRLTYSVSGRGNFLDNKTHSLVEQPIWTTEGEHIRVRGITEDVLERITLGSYKEALVKTDSKSVTNKYLYEQNIFSDVKNDMIHAQLDMLRSYILSKGAMIVFYPWVPLGKDIHKRSIVNIRKDAVIKYLDQEHFIDNGYHISNEGHKLVADEYLYPMIRRAFE